jgi:outer membrane receptor protein involved in Fe transport
VKYTLPKVVIDWVTGDHHFTNFFVGDYDLTGSVNNGGGTWGIERSDYSAFSSELRAQTTLDGPLDFMAGQYYQRTRLKFLQDVIFPGGLINSTYPDVSVRNSTLQKVSRTDGKTNALFGQLIWRLMPDLELTAGGRWTHETKDSVFVQPYVISPYQAAFVQGVPLVADQVFNNFSPEAIATWKITPNHTLWGGFKEGFKSGGFSGSGLYSVFTTVNDLAFRPETARGFEGGLKSTWLDGHLRTSLDFFSYRYNDFQVDYFNAAKFAFSTKNVGAATTKGVEFNADWAPPAVNGLVFHVNGAYDQARYADFKNAPCYGGQTIAQGCTLLADTSTVQDLSGKPTALAPKWTGSFQVEYNTLLGAGLALGFDTAVQMSSRYDLEPFGNSRNWQNAWATWDGGVHLGDAHGHWDVAVIVKNITDKFVLVAGGDAPSSGSGTGTAHGVPSDLSGFPNPPRTVELQLTSRF